MISMTFTGPLSVKLLQALFCKSCLFYKRERQNRRLRFRTIKVYPKDLRELPGQPEPAASWHSGFRRGAHARPQTTPVHHAGRRRGSRVAAGLCSTVACTRIDLASGYQRPRHLHRHSKTALGEVAAGTMIAAQPTTA